MKRSNGQPVVISRVIGVPRMDDENRSLTDPSSRYGLLLDLLLWEGESDGMSGRNGPASIFQNNLSRDLSVSAEVPTDARSMAVYRSCSRMMEEEE